MDQRSRTSGPTALTPEIERAIVRYGICRDTLAELDTQRITTTAQFNALTNAQDGLAEAKAILEAAGHMHRVVNV